MKNACLTFVAFLLAACVATPERTDDSLRDLKRVDIPNYDSDRSIGWAASREDYATARADGLGHDGLKGHDGHKENN